MRIEPAILEDARAIAEINVLGWRTAYESFVPAEYLATLSIEQREAHWREVIAAGAPEVLVAREEGGVCGWVAFGDCRDEEDAGEIHAIYVMPSHWSRGVGRALLSSARERLRQLEYRKIILWVFAENARAIRFYRAASFAPDLSSTKEVMFWGKPLKEYRFYCEIEK